MIATQLSTTPGGAAAALQRQEITAPIGELPLRIFRRTLYFRITTGGAAEALEVDGDATLRASFGALDYNALVVAEPAIRGSVSALDGGVLVALDAPRRVVRITLPNSIAPNFSRLEFYRLDGNTPSEEPSLTVVREGGLVIDGVGTVGVRVSRGGGSSRALSGPGSQLQELADDLTVFQTSARFNVADFTDARFLLRLKSSGGGSLSLGPSDVHSVLVRGYPTNPRIGLAVPNDAATPPDPGAAGFFWRATGEVGNATPTAEGVVDAGAALATELTRALGRFVDRVADAAGPGATPPLLPPHLDVALVVESDAPCQLHPPASGSSLRVEVRRVRESFADGAPKQVLRFEAGRSSQAGIDLLLPGGVALTSAVVRMDLSLTADRSSNFGVDTTLAMNEGSVGMRSVPGRAIAQRVQLSEATSVSAIAVAALALTAGAEAAIELREDAAGAPEGRVLAGGPLPAGAPGAAGWVALRLAEPVVVSTAPHWLVLTTSSGAVVWIARPDGGGLRSLGGSGADGSLSEVVGLGALYDLRTRADSAAAGAPPLDISLDGAPIALAQDADGRFSADLALAAQPHVGSAAPGSMVPVQLTFSAGDRGVVTVYPPRVVYD